MESSSSHRKLFVTALCRSFVLFVSTLLLTTNALANSAVHRTASIVTGASGYVGREVVNELLRDDQQTVYCLVRPSRLTSESEYWKSKPADSVHVLPYDMLDGGKSMKHALSIASSDDVDNLCVYHIASVFGPTDDHVQTAKDNVMGTEDVVRAISTVDNKKCRLVLTSSMAAVRGTGQEPLNGKYYTHKDWNTVSELGSNWGGSYQWSKAESERRAWDLARHLNVPMTSLCPSFVFGPPCDGKLSNSYSIQLVGQWVHGRSDVQSRLCVDIRDVAKAHVAAGTVDEAVNERFILSTESRLPSIEMAKSLKQIVTDLNLGDPDSITFDAKFSGGAIPIGTKEVEATERLQGVLGVKLRPVEET